MFGLLDTKQRRSRVHEVSRDPNDMAKIVRRRLLRAMIPALRKLDRVAKGTERFKNEHEIRACIALARLSPVFIARVEDADDEDVADKIGARLEREMTPKRRLAGLRLRYLKSLTPEQTAEFTKKSEAIHEEWKRIIALPMEQRRNSPHWEDLEETLWPTHLKEKVFMKEHGDEQ
jgi:hypothetical protein